MTKKAKSSWMEPKPVKPGDTVEVKRAVLEGRDISEVWFKGRVILVDSGGILGVEFPDGTALMVERRQWRRP